MSSRKYRILLLDGGKVSNNWQVDDAAENDITIVEQIRI